MILLNSTIFRLVAHCSRITPASSAEQGGRQEFQIGVAFFSTWAFRPLGFQAFRPLVFHVIGLLGLQSFRVSGLQTFGLLTLWAFGPPGFWAFRHSGLWELGPLGLQSFRPLVLWAFGRARSDHIFCDLRSLTILLP